jgi:archaellum component FlaG (FlaF/FlaG flagellin family)
MIRSLVALVVVSLLFVGPLSGSAQDATPEVGGAATIYGPDGTEVATITVNDFIDPFVDYDPNDPPVRSYHYVMVNIGVENTGEQTFSANPNDFVLVDSDGFAHVPLSVSRPDPGSVSDFVSSEMSVGDKISGAVFFHVANDSTLQSLKYGIGGGLLGTVLEINPVAPIPPGEAVTVIDNDGSEWSEVMVSDIVDPFQGFDPSYAPQRGQHYVLIDVTITNVGPRPMRVDPTNFFVLDTQGVLYGSVSFNLAAGATEKLFESQNELKTDASASGVIGFLVYNDSVISEVVYAPRGDRVITVATPRTD